jgi:formylglycine-generating enzyme required for sulfatase activity
VAKSAEERPQGFHTVVEKLRSLVMEATAQRTQPVSVPGKTKAGSILIWAVPVALLVLIGAGAAWWFTRSKPPEYPPDVQIPAKVPEVQPQSIPGMIYIPAGTFLAGEHNTSASLPGFYIDETEVSNGEFADYCKAAGCAPPAGAVDLPVVRVTIAQAREYAAWKGKRLPSALEWERAARGAEGHKYPWGSAEDESLANLSGKGLKPVKSYAAYPAYQMAGNAWEMVEGNVEPSAESKAAFAKLLAPPLTSDDKWIEMRGGSFHTPLRAAVAWDFARIPERYSSSDIGFRCAKSPQ